MNNIEFLNTIKESFKIYLKTSARSSKKLELLHGSIAADLYRKLNEYGKEDTQNSKYSVEALGFGEGKELKLAGRYIDKKVDITISKDGMPIAGLAVKYVMSNYKQNSNNYFESMLGETANIRSNNIPYFQIFIINSQIPYFDKTGIITHWEDINEKNLKKYITLSADDTDLYLHTPDKTLLFITSLFTDDSIKTRDDYINYYSNREFKMSLFNDNFDFKNSIIFNDYETFIRKVVHTVLGR